MIRGFYTVFTRPWWSPGFTLRQPSGGEKWRGRYWQGSGPLASIQLESCSVYFYFFFNLEYKCKFIFNQGSIYRIAYCMHLTVVHSQRY